MSGNIFDGCVAATKGLACNCKYCTAIKNPSEQSFPEGFPEWMKDYRLLKALELQETVGRNSKRLDVTEDIAQKVEHAHESSLPILDALEQDTRSMKPKVSELDTKAKALDTRAKTIEDRIAAIEAIKVVERLAALEAKIPVTPGTTRN